MTVAQDETGKARIATLGKNFSKQSRDSEIQRTLMYCKLRAWPCSPADACSGSACCHCIIA
eukprot:2814755-Karenia_brevis.AAC.1